MKKKSNLIANTLRSFAVSLAVALLFLVYLVTLGIPKTTARNLYNEATLALKAGETAQARNLLEEAYKAWPEPYIKQELDNLE